MTTKFFVPRADRRLGGRYELVECLGDGSYGWVWRAQRLSAGAIVDAYAPHAILLNDAEKAAFVANCIALTDDQVWMSARAERALSYATRGAFNRAGFTIHTVEIDEIEKAGGSLRCCIGEIY